MNVIDGILDSLRKIERRLARLETQEYHVPMLKLGDAVELTIATGAVTITKSHHKIDTEADAASDDLTTISGGEAGDVLLLRAADAARTVVVKHNPAANIVLAGAADFSMDSTYDYIMLINTNGTVWEEISRSSNE